MSGQDTDEIEIDLKDLISELRNKWYFILIGIIIGAFTAAIITIGLITPKYNAKAMIYMRGSGNTVASLSDLQIGSELTNDYAVIFKSRTLLTQVIDDLQLDMEYEQLAGMITVSNPTDTRILEVTVECTDAWMARDIANKVVEYGSDAAKEIDSKEPYIIDRAVINTDKVSPSLVKNTMIGCVIGMILVAGFFVMRYVMNDALQTESDVEKYLELPVLCQIPESHSSNYNEERKVNTDKRKKKSQHRSRK